jgi:hypothetical protein
VHEIAYHVRREAEERSRAAAAPDLAVAGIHLQLADRHADRAWSIGEQLSDRDFSLSGEDEPARTKPADTKPPKEQQPRGGVDREDDERQTPTPPPRSH